MKKLIQGFLLLLTIIGFLNAQWSNSSGKVYLTTVTDKVGIGTNNPTLGNLHVVGNASIPAIFSQLSAVNNNIILQTGTSETYGWKLMQDEVSTGDLYLKRRVNSVDSYVLYFKRSDCQVLK